jgi:hypothetical protein
VQPALTSAEPALLVVGHPGHELRVHGWLEKTRPIVIVLTDGSGHTGKPRIASTSTLIERAGATAGSIFGRVSDVELYRALLDENVGLFLGLVDELSGIISRQHIRVVAGDDAEGYNPTHDVCRLLVNAAVRIAAPSGGISNLAFALMTHPRGVAAGQHDGVSRMFLDDAALGRKLAAAELYPEMAGEVAAARRAWGDDAFRVETFRHVPADDLWQPGEAPPFYEQHGARRVDDGFYDEVIRYDRHIRPLADALAARVTRQVPRSAAS